MIDSNDSKDEESKISNPRQRIQDKESKTRSPRQGIQDKESKTRNPRQGIQDKESKHPYGNLNRFQLGVVVFMLAGQRAFFFHGQL